jgi:hypothetical protein
MRVVPGWIGAHGFVRSAMIHQIGLLIARDTILVELDGGEHRLFAEAAAPWLVPPGIAAGGGYVGYAAAVNGEQGHHGRFTGRSRDADEMKSALRAGGNGV